MSARLDTLRNFAKCSPAARNLFRWLHSRERNSRETKVRIASERTAENYRDLVALFKHLERLGFGTFVKGAHGFESRFVWRYSTKRLARGVVA